MNAGRGATPSADARGRLLRRRWVIERTLPWLRRNRGLVAHYEAMNDRRRLR
jgi:hypothetical protein